MVCIAGWAANPLRRGRKRESFCEREKRERESFPSPKRMEGPHIFRKWCLPVGIHQDLGLLSTPAASQLYNLQAQTGSFSQCFPRGFWWDANLINIMVKGLNPNSHYHVIQVMLWGRFCGDQGKWMHRWNGGVKDQLLILWQLENLCMVII